MPAPGLPPQVSACLFDMDGVVTDTAAVHAAAWKEMFDDFLHRHAEQTGTEFRPFDVHADYDRYVDGRPRDDGTRGFLASRGIHLPDGGDGDSPDADTVHALSSRKNDIVQRRIREDGVTVYDGTRRYLDALVAAGVPRALVTSSANATEVMRVTGLGDYFAARVDGTTIATEGLKGKPAPDTFLRAASLLGVAPASAAVFEDALAGVQAGRAGHFAVVVGVDRVGQADALRENGADVVVQDVGELLGR